MSSRRILDIDYQVLPGTERKTTDIIIERNGIVVVRPPIGSAPESIDAIVASKRMWIYRNLAEWRDLNATAILREWVNGETFLYLGRTYQLSLVENQKDDLILNEGRFCLHRKLLLKGVDTAKAAFEKYYTDNGLKRIAARVNYFAPKVGVESVKIKVKDMGYRWASCGKNNELSFHWKCMMAPPKIIDYVIVHELCHMHYRDHTDLYWNEVDKIMPDYRERKDWLKKNGASLDI